MSDKFIQPVQAIIITTTRMIGPCPRCGGSMQTYTCSWFTTESICTTCQQEEKSAPNFEAARAAEADAIRRGDFNFPGIGLAPEDVEALAASRRERK